jgi:hypothetical protein
MRLTRIINGVLSLACVLIAGCGSEEAGSTKQACSQSEPIELPDNPSCASLGLSAYAYKVEPVESGTYPLDGALGGTSQVTVNVEDLVFDWTATLPIDAVIVKGGPNANLYTYTPEAWSNSGAPALHAPVNPTDGLYYGLSHIELCFDYELLVYKTADTSFERAYTWTIDKTSAVTELLLSAGQAYTVPYTVTVAESHVDRDFRVRGAVSISNPAPFPATITGVVDTLEDAAVALSCSVTFPYELAPYASIGCSYDVAVPDGTARTNVVEVTTTGTVAGGSASALADFGCATMRSVDECVEVSDDHAGALGVACAGAPTVFEYTADVGPFACGEHTAVNTAAFVTSDTGATGSDSWTIPVTVPCDEGCTLTPGYWKTHSAYGPAPHDDTWALLADGADTAFYLSGMSYYQVLWTSPSGGNAYLILAHATIAAELNGLNGASLGEVSDELAEARAIFEQVTPPYVATLKGKAATELRARMLALAATLDAFNNGLIGPGHCDE